jgi:hypothetical protein
LIGGVNLPGCYWIHNVHYELLEKLGDVQPFSNQLQLQLFVHFRDNIHRLARGGVMIRLIVVESSAIERTHTISAISLHWTVVGEVTKT